MNVLELAKTFIRGVKTLNIPRIEDLPYATSPPIQFVYESTANLNAGNYIWDDNPSPLLVNRPLLDNTLYYFRNFSLTADIEELDFTTNIVTSPTIQFFRSADADAQLYREPIQMNKFYDQFTYPFTWLEPRPEDVLSGAFVGQLVQGAGLIGKNSITLKAVISATEVTDENFINLFKSRYPQPSEDVQRISTN